MVVGEWISECLKLSENIFCHLKGHIVEVRRGMTLVDDGRTDEGYIDIRNILLKNTQ